MTYLNLNLKCADNLFGFIDPSDDQDHELSDNEDDGNAHAVPEIVLDDDGYAKLPSLDGVSLKGQHELIRSMFHASYSKFLRLHIHVTFD